MSKRKSSSDRTGNHLSLELDEEQIAALELIHSDPSLKCLAPILDSIRKANSDQIVPHKKILRTRQATDFEFTIDAAKALGIDYNDEDISYVFNLKTEYLQNPGQLSEHFALVIKELKASDYVGARRDESFCRTVLDLIIIDRLRHLEDKDTYRHLQVSAEVPMSIHMRDMDGNTEIVKGRADWALGYGKKKSDTGSVLVVIEAKPYKSAAVGMPQLLVYMAAVHEARSRDRINKSVFGMVSDSKEFRFAFLDENKKFSTSRPLFWALDKSKIIAYIDMMLINAIESSPHTTPTKKSNQIILKFPKFLENKWNFGTESDDGEVEDEEVEDEEVEDEEVEDEEVEDEEDNGSDMVDIIEDGDRIVMKTVMRHGRPSSSG